MRTILIADDSSTIRRIVEHTFAAAGVRVVAAADGAAALDVLRREKPDLALCDVLMPGLTGYEVAEAAGADPDLRHIPVLLLTGAFEPFDEARAASCGAVGHIAKPFDSSALRRRVEEVLAGQPARPAPQQVEVKVHIETPPAAPPAAVEEEQVLDLAPPAAAPPPAPTGAEWPASAIPLPGDEAFDLSRPPVEPLGSPPAGPISDDLLREECRRQIAAIAPEIVREVAWEIVPDLLERLLRETVPPPPAPAEGGPDDPEASRP